MLKFNDSYPDLYADSVLSDEVGELAQVLLGLSPDGLALIEQNSLTVRLLNETALSLLNGTCEKFIGLPFPFAILGEEPHEICVAREGRDPIYVSIRKREVAWSDQCYWFLSMRDVTARVRLREQLKSDSLLDELTGLHNRRGFVTLGEQSIRLVERDKLGLLLIFVDLDGMKEINDRFGHQNGDAALEDVASLLRQTFRKADILARLGGDEFAVIAHGRSHDDKAHISRRLLENLQALNEKTERPFKLSLSVGFAHHVESQSSSLDDLLERADAAMYEDKRSKQNSRDHSHTANGGVA
jgi:diguanylate cyclase (GGDEF)-like protein